MERLLRYSWILADRLAVGERPRSFAELRLLGFRAILSLQEESEPGPEDGPGEGQRFRRVAIQDGLWGGVPSVAEIREAVGVVREYQAAGLCTYVHCYAGIGRSPSVCIAYLASSEGLGLGEACRRVAALHPQTEPTAAQLAAVALFLSEVEEA
jgi:hypothetical protein